MATTTTTTSEQPTIPRRHYQRSRASYLARKRGRLQKAIANAERELRAVEEELEARRVDRILGLTG